MTDEQRETVKTGIEDCIRRIRNEANAPYPDYETCADNVADKLYFLMEYIRESRAAGKTE